MRWLATGVIGPLLAAAATSGAALAVQEREAGGIEARVRCITAPGPPLPRLRMSRAETIRVGRRMIVRAARSPQTRLGRLVAGRTFSIARGYVGTYETASDDSGPSRPIGATMDLIFGRPTAVRGVVPVIGDTPKPARRRYTRRYGYLLYLRRVAGTVDGLSVVVDVRSGRIADVNSNFSGPLFTTYDPVPGPCPLAKPPPSRD